MYDGMKLYRGVVSYSAGTSIYVQIPALLGTTVSLPVSTIINTPVVSATPPGPDPPENRVSYQ